MNDDSRVLGKSDYEALHDNTGMGGIMFDVVGVDDVVVTKLGFQFNGGYGDSCPYDVYRLKEPGSYAGSEFDASAWTKIASGNAASVYPGGAVTGEFAVEVPAGATQAFYINGTQRGLIAEKTDAQGVYESDEHLQLRVGLGLWTDTDGAPFSDGYGTDYSVNPNFISVHYGT